MGTLHENGDHGQDPGILAAALFELKDFAPAFVAAIGKDAPACVAEHVNNFETLASCI